MAKQSRSANAFLKRIEEVFAVSLEREFRIGRKSFDAKYMDVLIEVDGRYWHNHPDIMRKDKLKEAIAKENGYRVYHFQVDTISDVPIQFLRYYKQLKPIIHTARQRTRQNLSSLQEQNLQRL
jgi:very-short-patch-repair endonuclease